MEKPGTTELPWPRRQMESDHNLLLRAADQLGRSREYGARSEQGLLLRWARNGLLEMADRYARLLAIHGIFDESERER